MLNAFQYIQSELENFYPSTEIRSFYYLIIEKLTGYSRTEIIVNKNTQISTEQYHEIKKIVEKLKRYEPIQYVLGETEFYGLSFLVNKSVLIPRPETEELMDLIVKNNDTQKALEILDIGTGSGCIAICLKKSFPNATVDAFDVSPDALAIAKMNAERIGLNVSFLLVDMLNPPVFNKKWDIIVSNPPYVKYSEKAEMAPNVIDNEPHVALFVPDEDPLLFYRKIADVARNYLKTNGKLYFEINRMFGAEISELLVSKGFANVELIKDLSSNDRMIGCIWPGNQHF